MASGANVARLPNNSYVATQLGALQDKAGAEGSQEEGQGHALLGLVTADEGRVAAYGDSNCLDSSHMRTDCFDLLLDLL